MLYCITHSTYFSTFSDLAHRKFNVLLEIPGDVNLKLILEKRSNFGTNQKLKLVYIRLRTTPRT